MRFRPLLSLLFVFASCDRIAQLLPGSEETTSQGSPTSGPAAPNLPVIPGGLQIVEAERYPSTDFGYVKVTSTFGNIAYSWVQQDNATPIGFRVNPGSTVTVDGVPLAVDPSGKGLYKLELGKTLLAASTEAITGEGVATDTTKTLAVVVTQASGPPITASVGVDLSSFFPDASRQLVSAVTRGRTVAGLSEVEPGPRKSLLYLPHFSTMKPQHFGQAGTLSEVDLIAVATDDASVPAGKCTGYRDNKEFPRVNIGITVKLFDAHTAAPIATQAFSAASQECPSMVFVSGPNDPVKVYPSDDAIKQWLESHL